MKIEMHEKNGKEYYNEFLYIALNHQKIRTNPSTKPGNVTKSAIIYEVISIVGLAILAYMFFTGSTEMLLMLALSLFGLLTILSTLYLVMVIIKIKKLRTNGGKSDFEFNNEYIELQNNGLSYRLDNNELDHIVINEYTICFFPKEKDKTFICISSKYKGEIIKQVNDVKLNEIIVDNINDDTE